MSSGVPEKVAERIRKVYAMAEHGESGERENARRILEKMLTDSGVSLEDVLMDSEEKYFRLVLKNDYDLQLLGQIYCMVADQHHLRGYRKGNSFHFRATHVHAIETLSLFSLFKPSLDAALELTFRAFLHKNEIFAASTEEKSGKDMTKDEENEVLKMVNMMRGMDRVSVHTAIEGRTA